MKHILAFLTLLVVQTGAVYIHCNFENVDFVVIGTAYSCQAVATLTGSTSIQSVTGSHQTGFMNNDVKAFRIWLQDLQFFPSGIADYFRNLILIELFYTNVLSISAEDLQPFPNLLAFGFGYNRLVNVDADLFSFNPELQWIDLTANRIEHVDYDFVKHLSNLTALFMGANVCVERAAGNRFEVLELASDLLTLCPPLGTTTTGASTQTSTTAFQTSTVSTTIDDESCTCLDEIDHLYSLNQAMSSELESLRESTRESNEIIEKRLLEVETKLREISSTPCAK